MKRAHQFLPLFSIFAITASLLTVVFFQMEERRRGYELLKVNSEVRKLSQIKREKNMNLARLTRPSQVESVAQNRLTMKKAESSQIIQLSGLTR